MEKRPIILVGLLVLCVLSLVSPKRRLFSPLVAEETGKGPAIGLSPWKHYSPYGGPLPDMLRRLECRDSAVDGDKFTGEHTSGWYRVAERTTLMVAGYPASAPNRIEINVRLEDGTTQTIRYLGESPGERWFAWQPLLPMDARALRIHAVDGRSSSEGGWVAFSEPFSNPVGDSWDPGMILQTFATVALSVVLIFGPGIVLRGYRKIGFIHILWPGPLALAVGGCLIWALGGVIAATTVAKIWVCVSLIALALAGYRRSVWTHWSGTEAKVFLLIPLVVLGSAAKAAFSGGPERELFGGSISRSLEVGGHSDSRISFHTVQTVTNYLSPTDPRTEDYFSPWHFSSRGPIAGLAAVPIVLATNGLPSIEMPNQAWSPFDRFGFAAYRIAMMGLSSLALVAVGGLLLRVVDEKRAWLGTSLLAMAPFLWHEVYFSWPKMVAASWVVGSFYALLEDEGFLAGLWLGGAYLFHPLALMSAPFLGLWALFRKGSQGVWGRIGAAAWFCLGLGVVVLLWNASTGMHQSTQAGFLSYAKGADEVYNVSLKTWLHSRWTDTLNTLVPGYIFFVNASHPSYNPVGWMSDGWVHFWLQYWTAAPFAVGLATFFALLPAFFAALKRQLWVASAVLLAPLVFLILFWGIATTGLMRESGHVLFLTGWIFLIWAAADKIPSWVTARWFVAIRALEILAMMFVTAFVAQNGGGIWFVNDVIWFIVATGSVVAVGCICVGAGHPLSKK